MRAVLYVDRTSLYYYGGNVHAPIALQPPPAVYSDMEILDSEELIKLIFEFVKTNKIQHCSLVIFFATQTCFQKAFSKTMQPEEMEVQKNEFIDYVPFNKVLSEVYPQKNDVNTVVAVNRELAFTLRDIFTKLHFDVESIVPSFALFGDQQPTFDINTAQQIVKHFSLLEKMSFPLIEQEPVVKKEDQDEFKEPKESKIRFYLMIGFFALLILMLVYMLFFFRKSPAKKTKSINSSTAPTTQQARSTSTPIPRPTEVIAAKDTILIRILNGSGTPGQADVIRARLEEGGYSKTEVGNAPTQESKTISIVVKPSVAVFHREEIDKMIVSLGHTTVIRESDEIDVDVLITTRRNPSNE